MQKQIDEIAKVLKDYTAQNHIMASHAILEDYAEVIYNAGYRKQSEGEWRDRGVVKRATTENAPIVECSECNITFCDLINNHYFMYHFCPNCGAKMKGGAE
jgi:hypothetical protein